MLVGSDKDAWHAVSVKSISKVFIGVEVMALWRTPVMSLQSFEYCHVRSGFSPLASVYCCTITTQGQVSTYSTSFGHSVSNDQM